MMNINQKEAKIFFVALDDLLLAVSIFSHRFAGLTAKLMSQFVITDICFNLA